LSQLFEQKKPSEYNLASSRTIMLLFVRAAY
jgi:hypothetical protein